MRYSIISGSVEIIIGIWIGKNIVLFGAIATKYENITSIPPWYRSEKLGMQFMMISGNMRIIRLLLLMP